MDKQIQYLFEIGGGIISKDAKQGQKILGHALRNSPGISSGWFNLGLALHQQGKIQEAIRAYKHAIKISSPPLEAAINNIAQDLLLAGRWKEGWEYYEERLKRMKDMRIYEEMFGHPWGGDMDDRKCEELIVIGEQGYGDTLQFCRFMKNLKDKGINASLFCQESLAALLRRTKDIGEIRTQITNVNNNTRWCPLLSLPHRLSIYERSKVQKESYLKPNPEMQRKWKNKLDKSKKLIVGIHWQGSPEFERKLYTSGRSIPIKEFRVLSELGNIEFLLLQKGAHRHEYKEEYGLNIVKSQNEYDSSYSFEETSGAVANCDLVIAADSCIVHLAGALGIPTWILLSKVPEWRWGLSGEDCIWYENARLFRQQTSGNWEEAMIKVLNELKEYKK